MTGTFRVWAPDRNRVDLVLAESSVAMAEGSDGWWTSELPRQEGMRYGFAIDGGPARPDPRSEYQPDGVHGLSQVVDHTSFEWTDGRWGGVELSGAVLYELHVGTFTPAGNFASATTRLPHLVELGIDAVELMPVVEFPGSRGWGYDGVDLYAPHHRYGDPDDLKRLIDTFHNHGIGVVLDVVYNHLGPDGNYLSEFGPYFSDRRHTHWGPAVNFDGEGSMEVRRFVLDNARMWFTDYHVDALRLDAVHAIYDESPTHILEELSIETRLLATSLGRQLELIAESDENDPRYVRSRTDGGLGLDAVWADEWHHALHALFTGEQDGYYEDFGGFEELETALRQAWVYTGEFSSHRGRPHGESPRGLPGDRFVIFTQNHDQIGNRAVGDRSSALMSCGRLRIAAALLLTGPFTPMLFAGEEWVARTPFLYFTDHEDPNLGAAVGEGRRREFADFGWDPTAIPDPQSEEAFSSSKLDWDELDDEAHQEMFSWYRSLIRLRREHPELADPNTDDMTVVADSKKGTIEMRRGPIGIHVNLGDEVFSLPVSGRAKILLASTDLARSAADTIALPPDSVVVIDHS